jgi:large subunit ribosomal protein L25
MNIRLEAEERTNLGKGASARGRREGWVPGVLYGQEVSNKAIRLKERDLEKTISSQGTGALVEVQLKGEKPYAALFREIQRHPVRGDLVHVDLYQVPLTSTIQTTVPLILEGEAIGVKNGGVFQHNLREVEIECIASKIPEGISVDISGLDLGETLKISDIATLTDTKIITDQDTVVATVLAPKLTKEEEEEAVETETPTEPEEETPSQE